MKPHIVKGSMFRSSVFSFGSVWAGMPLKLVASKAQDRLEKTKLNLEAIGLVFVRPVQISLRIRSERLRVWVGGEAADSPPP